MKEFAGDKQGAVKKDTGDAGGRAKDDSRGGQVQGFGGYGAGEGQVAPPDPMAAMRFGHMGAIRMAQSGGVDVTKHVGKSAKGGGGASGEVNSDIAGKVTASTEVDVGDVVIEEDPRLEEAGKSGVAKDAKTVAVKPDASDSTVAHELVHVVQMRGGSRVSGEGKTPDTEVSQAPEGNGKAVDVEAEANEGAKAILSGQKFEVHGKASGPLYEEDEEEAVATTPEVSASDRRKIQKAIDQAKMTEEDEEEFQRLKSLSEEKKEALKAIETSRSGPGDAEEEIARLDERIAEIDVVLETEASKKILSKAQMRTDIEEKAETSVEEWFKGIVPSATFMGKPILPSKKSATGGVHAELYERLQAVEAYLVGQGKTADTLGIEEVKGLRPPIKAAGGEKPSLHCYGMAIDINVCANPFLQGGGNKKDQIEAIERATKLVGDFEFTYTFRPADYELPENVGALWDRLHEGSDALKKYFALSKREHEKDLDDLLKRHPELTKEEVLVDIEKTRKILNKADFKGQDDPENGFMDLKKVLVEALVQVGGLTWGGQYKTGRDLMHFDLRTGSIPRSLP